MQTASGVEFLLVGGDEKFYHSSTFIRLKKLISIFLCIIQIHELLIGHL